MMDYYLEHYRQNGYCIIPDVLTPEECRFYIDEATKISQKQAEPFLPIINPDRVHPVFRRLLAHPKVVGIVETILGTKISALQSLYYFKPPKSMGRDLHQDNFYVQTDREALVGSWISLVDSDQENGGLFAYPGSHREGILPVVDDPARKSTNAGDFKNDRGYSSVVPPQYQKEYLSVPAGAAAFMHGHLLHGSEENLSDTRYRHAFAGHYIKQGFKFTPGTHAKREVIDVY